MKLNIKIIILTFCYIFITAISATAEYWIKTSSNNSPVYIDLDSITKTNNGVFFNIFYKVDKLNENIVYTIFAQDTKAGIANTKTLNEYLQNPKSMTTKNIPEPAKLNTIKTTAKIYNAYVIANSSKTSIEQAKSLNKAFNPNSLCSKEPDFGPYMQELQRRIKLNWNPPKGNESRRIIVLFKIAKSGRMLSCRVIKSSGLLAADQAALRAVELTAPFKPLPVEFKGESIDIQFTFDYNIFGARY